MHANGLEENERQLEAKADTAMFFLESLQLEHKGRKNESGDALTKDSNETPEIISKKCRTVTQGGLCAGRFGQYANFVVQEGRCLKCSRRCTCRFENCANYPVKGGFCIRHGATTSTCSHGGCAIKAKQGGLCLRHGAKLKICTLEGCTKMARCKGGVCWSHNATDVI